MFKFDKMQRIGGNPKEYFLPLDSPEEYKKLSEDFELFKVHPIFINDFLCGIVPHNRGGGVVLDVILGTKWTIFSTILTLNPIQANHEKFYVRVENEKWVEKLSIIDILLEVENYLKQMKGLTTLSD